MPRLVRQTEAAECGLACLATIASHFGLDVDMASLRFDTHTLSDAELERDSKRVAAVVVGRALLTHHELQALFARRFPHRAVLPGATIYYR